MSNVFVGQNAAKVDDSPAEGYTGVKVVAGSTTYTAGNATGQVLSVECPWGTQATAESILTGLSGKTYKPLAVSQAILDPSAELGDGITVDGNYSGIYKMTTKFGRLMRTDVEAPKDMTLKSETTKQLIMSGKIRASDILTDIDPSSPDYLAGAGSIGGHQIATGTITGAGSVGRSNIAESCISTTNTVAGINSVLTNAASDHTIIIGTARAALLNMWHAKIDGVLTFLNYGCEWKTTTIGGVTITYIGRGGGTPV